jgi:hypothetical protein
MVAVVFDFGLACDGLSSFGKEKKPPLSKIDTHLRAVNSTFDMLPIYYKED